jgi:fatty acyl-CoA reductase
VQQKGANGAEVLLTGASGFLGKVVLFELLRRRTALGIERVHVLLRRRGDRGAAERLRAELLGSRCFSGLPSGWDACLEAVEGDCEEPGAGIAPSTHEALTASLTHVIHCAASVEFHLPVARAASANAASALQVLELARECPRLAALVDVSTAYVTPHPGAAMPVEERLAPLPWDAEVLFAAICAGRYDAPEAESALLAEARHPNTYTLTKALAEHLLARRRGAVPLVLVRPSIIAASWRHPFPGWIDSAAAFALFAVGIGSGRMRVVLARPDARLDLVPVDVVAERVVDAAFDGVAQRGVGAAEPPIRHAVAGWERSPTLRLCRARVGPYYERHPLPGAPPARVRHLGPAGWRWRIAHHLHHRRPAAGASWPDAIEETSRRFAYFTHTSFRFSSSVPFVDPDFTPGDYLDVVCHGVWRHLLGGDEREVAIAGSAHRRDGSRAGWVLRQPEGNAFLRLAGWAVDAALARALDRVTVDEASFREAVSAAPPDALLVVAPAHRSYLDFVLVSYLCFARPDLGIAIPHVAAASDFQRVPLLGRLFEHLHAFYLERGVGREDKRLTEAVDRLVREGRVLEFFVEGQRSRSRRFLPPRRGLLRSLQATGQRCALLPVAISYEHLPEEATFLAELQGHPKPPMRLRDLLAWTGRLFRGEVALGRAHLACAPPVLLDLEADVYEVGRRVVAGQQERMATTTHQLRAFLAIAAPPDVDAAWLADAIVRRGGRVLETSERPVAVDPAVERCWREHFAPLFLPEAALGYARNPAIEHHVRENAWAPARAGLDPEQALGDRRVRAVVRALFDPVRADHAAAARALAAWEWADGTAATPAAIAQRLPGSHLPDVEAAFRALAERGALTRGSDSARWARGPVAGALGAYADACEALGLDEEPPCGPG